MSQYGAAWDAYAANAAQHQHAAAMAAHHQNYGYGHAAAAHDYGAAGQPGQLQLPQLHAAERLRLGRPGRAHERPAGRLDVPRARPARRRARCFKARLKPQSAEGRAQEPALR